MNGLIEELFELYHSIPPNIAIQMSERGNHEGINGAAYHTTQPRPHSVRFVKGPTSGLGGRRR